MNSDQDQPGKAVFGDHAAVQGDVFTGDKNIFQRITNIFPGDSEQQRALRNRINMLQLVWNTWVEGVLKQSLHNEVLLELGMQTQPDAVQHPWEMLVQMPDREPAPVPPGTTMLELFDQAAGALLILGEPGSGKTTMLLELCRLGVERAQEDPLGPIPVVFNLSSWKPEPRKTPGQAFADWLVDELRSRYSVSVKIGRPWVEEEALLLLLDGLDEVQEEDRAACIQAINAFHAEHSMPVVVCSRRQEYHELSVQLSLYGAVLIQPLTVAQVDTYLSSVGGGLERVRLALQADPELHEFARTPLILSLLVLAYRDASDQDLRRLEETGEYRKCLFDVYIARMFKRRAADRRYTPEQALGWLSWMAGEMLERNRTLFTLEDIQPGWLPYSGRLRRNLFRLVFGLAGGLCTGLVFGLFGSLVGLTEYYTFSLYTGSLGALLFGLGYGSRDLTPTDKFSWSWKKGIRFGLIGLLIGALVPGLLLLSEIGGVVTMDDLLAALLLGALIAIPTFGPGGLLIGLLLGGLEGVTIGKRSSPSEGINTSLKRFMIGMLVGGLVVWLVVIWARLAFSVKIDVVFLVASPIIALISGLLVGLGFGGAFLVNHYITRFLLYRSGRLPWKLVDFLDYASERILLRRAGGGYIFIHRMLMEHFAEMGQNDPATPASRE